MTSAQTKRGKQKGRVYRVEFKTINHAWLVIGGLGTEKSIKNIVGHLTDGTQGDKGHVDYTLMGFYDPTHQGSIFHHDKIHRQRFYNGRYINPTESPSDAVVLKSSALDAPICIKHALESVLSSNNSLTDEHATRDPETEINRTAIIIASQCKGAWKLNSKGSVRIAKQIKESAIKVVLLAYHAKGATKEKNFAKSLHCMGLAARAIGGVCAVINPDKPRSMSNILDSARNVIIGKFPSPTEKEVKDIILSKRGEMFDRQCRKAFKGYEPL
ncbi:MAG TPA: hypothetical protein DCY07_05900 [Rhodospirillaceae bacterium]|nr:hypothetical protein [Rhodospirillaceae bacterium]